MVSVEVDASASFPQRLTPDEVTDMIEAVVDELDRLDLNPTVGTHQRVESVDVRIGMEVDVSDSSAALARGCRAVPEALDAAGVPAHRIAARVAEDQPG